MIFLCKIANNKRKSLTKKTDEKYLCEQIPIINFIDD